MYNQNQNKPIFDGPLDVVRYFKNNMPPGYWLNLMIQHYDPNSDKYPRLVAVKGDHAETIYTLEHHEVAAVFALLQELGYPK